MLNRVEDKDSRFISGFKFKEKSLRVYRGQWDILVILAKTSIFSRFSLLIINGGEICGVRSTKRFDWKMSVKVPITFPNLRLAISCLWGRMKHFKAPLYERFLLC